MGGAAYHAGKSRAGQDQVNDQATQDQATQDQPEYVPPPPQPAAAPPPSADTSAELQKLAQLHDDGALNDAEFSQAKANLLGM